MLFLILLFTLVAADEKVSVNLAAARQGLSLDEFPNNMVLN